MRALSRNWWALVLRGVLAVLFGLAAIIWPGITVTILILLFGAYAFVDGVLALASAVRTADRHGNWWPLVVEGIVGVGVGLVAFFYPEATAVALVFLVAFWAIVTGALEIVAAVRLREEISNELLLGIGGVVSVLLGLALIVFPGAGILAFAWFIGIYALIFGVLLIVLGLRLRQLQPI